MTEFSNKLPGRNGSRVRDGIDDEAKEACVAVQERGIRTRQRIIDAAAIVFGESGYDGASTSMILRNARGVVQGSMYFHFPSKRHIALAVIDAQHERVMGETNALITSKMSAMEKFLRASFSLSKQIMDDPLVRAGTRLILEEESLRPESIQTFSNWIDAIEMLTKQAIEEGDLRSDLDPRAFAQFSISVFSGTQLVSHLLGNRVDLYSDLSQAWSIILTGVTRPERTERWVAYVKGLYAGTSF